MSEEQALYTAGDSETESPNEIHEIRDESPHNHFTSIPNIVDDMHLSPYAFRLYSHFKRVAGDFGACWQSSNTLAIACNMSTGMISKAKHELADTNPPLIRIQKKTKPGGDWYHEIKITDIWTINSTTFSPSEGQVSYSENRRSPGESKKNPIKKNQELKAPSKQKTTIHGIEAAIAMGRTVEESDLPGIDAIEETLLTLEKGLHRGIDRAGAWQDLAKWINKKTPGALKTWIDWYMSDLFRVNNAWRMTPAQVRAAWPQAFHTPEQEGIHYPTIQELEAKGVL